MVPTVQDIYQVPIKRPSAGTHFPPTSETKAFNSGQVNDNYYQHRNNTIATTTTVSNNKNPVTDVERVSYCDYTQEAEEMEFNLPQDTAEHIMRTLFSAHHSTSKEEIIDLTEDEPKTPDDERLQCLLLQLGVHKVKDLPHLQLQENELECFGV